MKFISCLYFCLIHPFSKYLQECLIKWMSQIMLICCLKSILCSFLKLVGKCPYPVSRLTVQIWSTPKILTMWTFLLSPIQPQRLSSFLKLTRISGLQSLKKSLPTKMFSLFPCFTFFFVSLFLCLLVCFCG